MNGERVYRWFMVLYPPGFRRRYGADLLAFFHEHRRDPRFAGRLGAIRFWRHTIADVMRTAGVEWYAAARAPGLPRWESLTQDVHLAARGLLRTPGFALAVAGTLALGIGAGTTMYGVASRLLFLPPPHVADPDRVVKLYFHYEVAGRPPRVSDARDYRLYDLLREHARTLGAVAAYAEQDVAVGTGPEAALARATLVSGQFWRALGTSPAHGRFFGDDEAEPASGARVVVLGHAFWKRRFGGDERVIGQTVAIKGSAYDIIGVAPRGFRGVELSDVDIWLPLAAFADGERDARTWPATRGGGLLRYVARVGPEAGLEHATTELSGLLARDIEQSARPPDAPPTRSYVTAAPVVGALGRDMQRLPEARVAAWLAGVAVVLLGAACATVASLLLLRAMRRRREIAVRTALGMPRSRLVIHLFSESTMLALAGGVGALAVAIWGGAWITRVLLPGLAWEPAALDWRMFAVAGACVAGTAFAAGLAPVLHSRGDAGVALRDSTLRTSTRRSRIQTALLVVQTALSLVLLAGAGLFLRSLDRIASLDIGFDTDNVLAVTFDFIGSGRTPWDISAFHERALERVRALPGVAQAGLVSTVPLRTMRAGGIELPPDAQAIVRDQGSPLVNHVTPEFFETTGMRIVQGRGFEAHESDVIVINETMGRFGWPNRSPLGECVPIRSRSTCSTVIGIVRDHRRFRLREPELLMFYMPLIPGQGPVTGALLVRVAPDHRYVTNVLRHELSSMEANVPFARIETLGHALDPQIRPFRIGAAVFTAFGIVAMLLAATGLYGALAYAVTQRTRELGVRVAVGAIGRDIVRLVLGDGLRVVGVGIVCGLAAALVGGRWLGALLFDVSPHDPLVLGMVAAVLVVVAILASVVPAWRATKVAPMDALRAE